MRVCVFGAGAIGGHLAVRFARGGADVSVVARGPHLAAIQRNGLTVHAIDGEHRVKLTASDDPAHLGPQEAVVVTVKAPALPQVAAGIAPLLRPDTGVAFVMNGIPWWYFHALPGKLEGHRLPRIDPEDATVARRRAGTSDRWRGLCRQRRHRARRDRRGATAQPRGVRRAGWSPVRPRRDAGRIAAHGRHHRRGLARHPHRDLEQADQQPGRRHAGSAGGHRAARRLRRSDLRRGGRAGDAGGGIDRRGARFAPAPQLRAAHRQHAHRWTTSQASCRTWNWAGRWKSMAC